MERLQKYLATAGIASRRHAEQLITSGRVTVNNRRVVELGTKIEPGKDLVTVDGKLVAQGDKRTYFILYKPPGVVTTLNDPQGRPTVGSLIEKRTEVRVFPVGRLDYDAEGALLLTDDGELANRLMHPSFQVARTYLAKVKGVPTAATLEKLRSGVRLEDGPAKPLSVEIFEEAEKNLWLKLVVGEGRPHLIKRLCAAIGHPVVRLFRPFHASIGVEGLMPGHLRALTEDEVNRAYAVSEGKGGNEPALKLPARRHGKGPWGGSAEESASGGAKSPPKPIARKRALGGEAWGGAAATPKRYEGSKRFGGGLGEPGRAGPARAGLASERPAGGGSKHQRSGSVSGRPARSGDASRPAGSGRKGASERSQPTTRGRPASERPERAPTRGGPRAEHPAQSDGAGGPSGRRQSARPTASTRGAEKPAQREWTAEPPRRGSPRPSPGGRGPRKPFTSRGKGSSRKR